MTQTPRPAGQRRAGEKRDIVVYSDPEAYASFPQLVRTNSELVLLFQVQELAKLRAASKHPHYQAFAVPRWASSRDGGLTWSRHDTCPPLGAVEDISYGSVALADGGTVTLTFSSSEAMQAIIEHGSIGYRPYQQVRQADGNVALPVSDIGPFSRFYPHGMTRTSAGKLIAAGYAPMTDGTGRTTAVFLVSEDEGRTWRTLSHIQNTERFSFSEPAIIETRDGRLLTLLRVDWDPVPAEERPDAARVGYGYYLYRSWSADGGRNWEAPERLPIWGHPPYLLRLRSGSLLLVYGHRREPYGIRAALSRDEGQTWDPAGIRTVHRFDPGSYDLGYPVATQLADGSIVCAYYGYATTDVGETMPHAIFVSVFDEAWLTASSS